MVVERENMDSDKRLVEKIKLGNKQAYERLVVKYQDEIIKLLYDLIGSYEKSVKIAQEVFLKGLNELNKQDQRLKFSSWIYRIALNLSMDFNCKETNSSVEELDNQNKGYNDEEKSIPSIEFIGSKGIQEEENLRHRVNDAMNTLSNNQRIAIILRYYHSKNIKEISEIMDCNEDIIRINIFNAIHQLGKKLN